MTSEAQSAFGWETENESTGLNKTKENVENEEEKIKKM